MDIQHVILLILLLSIAYAAIFILAIKKYKSEVQSLARVNSNHIETIIRICKSLNLDSSNPNNAKIVEIINQVQEQNKELNIKNTALEEALDIAQDFAKEEGINEYGEVLAELRRKVAEGQTLTLQDRENLFKKRIREKRVFKQTYNAFQQTKNNLKDNSNKKS